MLVPSSAAWFGARENFTQLKNQSKADLTKRANQAIRDLVEKEIAAGLKSVTDGEFPPSLLQHFWISSWGFGGIDHVQAASKVNSMMKQPKADSALVVESQEPIIHL